MGQLTTTPEALAVRWAELMHAPTLRNLPYKVELNAWGNIELSPTSFRHSHAQGYVAKEFGAKLPHEEVLIELAILTDIGVRVPDVAWGSSAYHRGAAGLNTCFESSRDLRGGALPFEFRGRNTREDARLSCRWRGRSVDCKRRGLVAGVHGARRATRFPLTR